MEVSDTIAVMDHARIAQVGSPRELYERPASAFVMSFVGPVARLGEEWVRPHDLDILTVPSGASTPARVVRLVHLGFEVRVEMERDDGTHLSAQVTREAADELGVGEGDRVHVRPRASRVFSAAEAEAGAYI